MIRIVPAAATVVGDVNFDFEVNLTDAVTLLNALFLGGSNPCPKASDFNEDSMTDLTDAVAILNYLFLEGPNPSTKVSCSAG